VQLILIVLFLVIYRYPFLANIPSTIPLRALQEDLRAKVYETIRDFFLWLLLLVNLLLTVLLQEIIRVARAEATGLNNGLVFGLVGVILALCIGWAVKLNRMVAKP